MINPEQFYNDFIWIVDKIKKEMAYKSDFEEWYEFVIECSNEAPSRYKQYQILRYLEGLNLFDDFKVKGDKSNEYKMFNEEEPVEVPQAVLFKIKDEVFYKKSLLLLKALREKMGGREEYKITLNSEEIQNEIKGVTNSFSNQLQNIDGEIIFDDDTVLLKLNNRKCNLKPFRNEHLLCRYIFGYMVNEPIQWDLAYEAMVGEMVGQDPSKRDRKKLYDTIQRLNGRVLLKLGIKNWINWENKSFRRTR